jgi:hypothetical protein
MKIAANKIKFYEKTPMDFGNSIDYSRFMDNSAIKKSTHDEIQNLKNMNAMIKFDNFLTKHMIENSNQVHQILYKLKQDEQSQYGKKLYNKVQLAA